MNRLAFLMTLFAALLLAQVAGAQCCGGVTSAYYAPTAAYYAPTTTTYYAPPPTMAYYAAPTTAYYAAPTTVYYQQPLVGAGITRVGYAPVTYATPRATYYAPVMYTTAYSPWSW